MAAYDRKNRDMTGRNGTEKRTGGIVCAALTMCAALLLTACGGEEAAEHTGQAEDWIALRSARERTTKHDLQTEPEHMEQTERVDLNACESGGLVLKDSGDIWLSGSMEGQIVVDLDEDELVHLYLAGVEITSPNGPAILIQEASKAIVTVVSGTENSLADAPDYTDFEETPGCLYSVCDLTVNGGGILRVSGYGADGVRSKDRIKLLDVKLSVQAKGDGIRGNDGIFIQHAAVAVESEKNGLRTVNSGINDRGVIEADGGTLSVIAGANGICAASDLYLYRGQYSVNAVEERTKAEGTAYISDGCME